jgi:hypothetical protein
MEMPMKRRMLSLALIAAALVCTCSVRQGRAEAPTLVFAVAEIHYVDTSVR